MAINLLPSEQKLKFKKQKSNSGMQSIEMTGPKKVKKHKSSIKNGGVLGFFKQVFSTPKIEEKIVEEKIESTSIQAPAKKILFKEKITFKTARRVPKVEYHLPQRKPKSLDRKESLPVKNKISNIFHKPKIDSGSLPKTKKNKTIVTAKEQFPKYHSVNTEQLFDKKNLKTKKVRIIEVVSENGGNKNRKKQKQSIWKKIQNWFNNIFGNKKPAQPAPDPAKISGLSGFPKPKDGELEISYEQKILREEQKKSEKNKKQYIAPKIDQAKKIFPDQKILSYDKSKDTKEATFVIENKIEKPISPKAKKNKDLYIPSVTEKQIGKAKNKIEPKLLLEKFDEKKSHKNYFSWLSNFWKSFLLLFSKTKKVKSHNKSNDSNFITQVRKNTEVVDEGSKSVFNKIDFNKPKDESETVTIKKEIPIPPIIDDAPSPSNKDLSNIHQTIDDHKIKMTSVIKNINIPSPLPPVEVQDKIVEEKEKENIDRKKVKKEVAQTKGVPEEIVGLDWEVNLIPEDEQEKNIPVSKILYLIMSVVVSSALVFGGWLWANYYYNTITTTIGEIDAEISIKEAEIAKYSQLQEEARITQNKITSVQELLNKHIYWSEFFNKLEFYTITDVYYSSMSVDVNGVVTLSAVGSSYENAVKQLMVMEQANDFVTKVTISDIVFLNNEPLLLDNQEDIIQTSTENVNVTFNINLEVQPEIFYYPKINL